MSTEDTNEFIDSTTDEEVLLEEVIEDEEESESEDDIEKVRESNKKLFERAKAAEEKLRSLKKAQYDAQVNKQDEKPQKKLADSVSSEELKLIARGLSDVEIDKAKGIAKGFGMTLSEAIKDPLFVAFRSKLAEDTKKADAKLGASKGSSQSKKETFHEGMTPEEHKALWLAQRN